MHVVSLDSQGRISNVYDPEQYLDDGVETHEITEDDFATLTNPSTVFSDWLFQNGQLVHDPLPPYVPPEPTPQLTIPKVIL